MRSDIVADGGKELRSAAAFRIVGIEHSENAVHMRVEHETVDIRLRVVCLFADPQDRRHRFGVPCAAQRNAVVAFGIAENAAFEFKEEIHGLLAGRREKRLFAEIAVLKTVGALNVVLSLLQLDQRAVFAKAENALHHQNQHAVAVNARDVHLVRSKLLGCADFKIQRAGFGQNRHARALAAKRRKESSGRSMPSPSKSSCSSTGGLMTSIS